jgi:hypothetical protein
MGVSAFTKVGWDNDDNITEKCRQGIKWSGPRRDPRESLLKDRKTTVRVSVKDATPPNVKLNRLLNPKPITASGVSVAVVDCRKPSKLYRPEQPQLTPPPLAGSELTPRFYRWRPGAKPEECQPVY